MIRRAAVKAIIGQTEPEPAEAKRGRALLEALPGDDPTRLVRVAVARMVDGHHVDLALESLRAATEAGLACPAALRADPDLATLRDQKAFGDLIARVDVRSKDLAK